MKISLNGFSDCGKCSFGTLLDDYDTDDISEYNVGNILPVLIIGDKRFIGEVKEKEIDDYLEGCNL